MEEILVQGFCLSVKPVGEYDQLLTILTADYGLMRVYARGILRSSKKAWQICTRPGCVAELRLTRGRSDLWSLADGQLLYYPDEMNQSWEQLQGVMSMIRAILDTQWLAKPSPDLLPLLFAFTRQIAHSYHPSLLPVFYLKLLTHEGHFPLPTCCTVCDADLTELLCIHESGDCTCTQHAAPTSLQIPAQTHAAWRAGALLLSFEMIRKWECPSVELIEALLQRIGTLHTHAR